MHGSRSRRPPSGYKVVFVPFSNGRPAGAPEDVLTGFVGEDGHAFGRPVGVVVDKTGALLVADDVGNVVWRVVPVSTREDAGDSRCWLVIGGMPAHPRFPFAPANDSNGPTDLLPRRSLERNNVV